MFRICPALTVFSFVLYVFTLVNCATNSGSAPEWVYEPERIYPRAQYITGMGTGRSRAEAEAACVAEIARTFGTTVSIRAEGVESYSTRNGDTSARQDFNQKTIVSVYTELFNLKYAPPWQNPQTKEWTALAYINREAAWEIYEPRVRAAAQSFVRVYNDAGAGDPLSQYSSYHAVLNIANEAGGVRDALKYAQALYPQKANAGIYKEAQNAVADVQARLYSAADEAIISIQCEGDFEGIITGAIAEAFRDCGFKTATGNARGTGRAVAKVSDGKEKQESGTFFTPHITLTVISNGRTLLTWRADVPKRGAWDEAKAKRERWNALAQKVKEELPRAFNAAMEGITRRTK